MSQATTIQSSEFLTAVKHRRSYYGIGNKKVVSEERIQEIVGEAVLHTPSSFNSQSARVLVLFGQHHDKLWSITTETLRKIVPADQFDATQQRMNGFAAGYGTILFFEDESVVEGLQQKFPTYKDNFPLWSLQSNGMLQYVVWTALELEGLGCSLQHYNPLIDDEVRSAWNVPKEWKLIAQMPFGNPTQQPGDKSFEPLEKRMKVHQ
ncbi:nitroreductase family protein [Paenibacillus antri]|uniref:Nitroreductase family protein n=1 Tax=Paenibacillus antri TaxID=2582848 RepID=A0A5R9FZS4_9BACL|nr:nitroreductase family protein [Paenibacillus antri]TLS49567.1 nitroreductase family protein [Paenibacillus antri]